MNRSIMRRLALAAALAAALLSAGCGKSPTSPPVALPFADSIAVSPDSASVSVGTSFRFTVAAFDSSRVAISAALSFVSSDPAVFTVGPGGRVAGVSEGVGVLRVSSGAARDSAVVTVRPAARGWFAQSSGTALSLRGVFFQADGHSGWAVGDAGKILHTTDGGGTWNAQASGTLSVLQSVWFTSADSGWAVGLGGTVLRTRDGGATWSRMLNVGAAGNLNDVQFATPDTGWVVGAGGAILRTFDGGASWQLSRPTTSAINSVSFAGTRDGWAVGEGGVILGTHDRGLSWYTVQPSVTAAALRGVWRVSPARANAAGSAGVAPRTIAAADTAAWELGDNPGAQYDLRAVCFPTPDIGFAAGFNAAGAVLRSADGGATWQPQTANTTGRLNDVFFVDAQRGWAVGENGAIVHTVSGGQP